MARAFDTQSKIPRAFTGSPFNYNQMTRLIGAEKSVRNNFAFVTGRLTNGPRHYDQYLSACGWEGITFDETALREVTVPGDISGGLASWSLWAYIRLVDNGAQVQNIRFRLHDPDTLTSQVLYHAYASGAVGVGVNVGTGVQLIYLQGSLLTQFIAPAGKIMRAQLIVDTVKTNPRPMGVNGAAGHWDGALQFGLTLY